MNAQTSSSVIAAPHLHSPGFELRDYQKRVIAELYQLFRQGKRSPFIYAPTGAGKTAIAAKVITDFLQKGQRVLFIIHRDPLVPQTQEALRIYGIEAGIIKSGWKEDRSKQVQIASIQSLARRQFPEDTQLVIIDECHTTAWYASFGRVKAHYPGAYFVGLTGSPWRTKSTKERMGEHFDSFVKAPAPAELIRIGFLARPRYFGFGGLLDIAKIDNGKDGDFNESQMQAACMIEGFNERVVKEYSSLCSERTAIAFCAGVKQSQYLSQLFNAAGIRCEHLEADTPHSERREMYRRLASGETRILSSVGTLTEGFDVPNISAVILARPTRSLALLFQMSGRGLRLAPNKKDCIMLDFGENFKRLCFLTDPQPITLDFIKEAGSPALKECPNCHAMISVFLMVCPECGYEFPPGDKDNDAEEFEVEFGELFSRSDKLKLKYLRAQIRTRYSKLQPIDRVWETFQEKYDHYPPNEWHLGAVFGTYRTEVNRQKYLDYLHKITSDPKPDWIKFHMRLEFGIPGKQYQQSRQSTYTAPPGDTLQKLNWWSLLGVLPLAQWCDIKAAYKDKAMKFHPDVSDLDPGEATERMKLINWAFEEARQARGD